MMVILLAVICLSGLFDHSLWSGNDTREGAMISEMVRTHCWVAPVFNGVHYLEKPPLLHWTGVLFCRIFHSVNEGLVRLPAAVYAFCTLLIIVSWARALGREQAGFAAAFMCAISVLFLEYARIVLTDSCLTFMVVFSLWLFWRAQTAEKWFIGRYLLFLFVSAFAFYAKGLIGPGMIWLSVMAWLALQRRFRLILVLVPVFAFVFVFVLAPWVFALWKAGGGAYLYNVFWENQFGRFLYFNDQTLPLDPYLVHKEPVYFYLLSLPVRLLPWTLLVVPALYYWFRRESPIKGDLIPARSELVPKHQGEEKRQSELAGFLKTSLLAIVFLLHVSSAKAACYALPLFPFIFLMTAVWLEDASAAWLATPSAWSAPVDRWLIGITFVLTGIAVILAPAAYLLGFIFRFPAIWNPCPVTAWIGFIIAIIAITAGCFLEHKIWRAFKGGRRRAALLAMPVVVAVAGIVGASVFVPAVDFARSYMPFCRFVLGEINAGRHVVFPSDSERDLGAFMFYLDSRLETVSLTNSVALSGFLRDKNEPFGIVAPARDMKLVFRQLGDKPFRVLKADHCGKKSDSFRLMIINPAVKKQSEPPGLQGGKPKRARK